jgi:hypothetical protein
MKAIAPPQPALIASASAMFVEQDINKFLQNKNFKKIISSSFYEQPSFLGNHLSCIY